MDHENTKQLDEAAEMRRRQFSEWWKIRQASRELDEDAKKKAPNASQQRQGIPAAYRAGQRTQQPSATWECTVCERSMPAADKELHLGTRKHGQNENAQARFQAEATKAAPPGPHGKYTWDCDVCERTMAAKAKEGHLAGGTHRAREFQQLLARRSQAQSAPAPAPPPPPPQNEAPPIAAITLRIVPSTNPSATPQPKPHTEPIADPQAGVPPGQWHCTLCTRTMPLGSRNHHCLGREHRWKFRLSKMNGGGGATPPRLRRPARGGEAYCECGDLIMGGEWCKNCDFRAESGWGKKIEK